MVPHTRDWSLDFYFGVYEPYRDFYNPKKMAKTDQNGLIP